MDNFHYFISGEIKGITKKEKENNNINKMLYITEKIKEEINSKFKNESYIHIYDRFSKKSNLLKIFVILLNNTKYNKRDMDITFLIIIKEEYPNLAPLVFCLTEFNKNLDIFDMRNIQKNLIPEWANNYKINDLIETLPSFVDNTDYQIQNKLLPNIGEYYKKSLVYDINDFLLNENNKFFRVKILSKETLFIQMYIIITKNNLIFLKPENETNKNLCKIKYVINLIGIERLRRFLKEGEIFLGLSCFKIVNNKYINNSILTDIFELTICVEENHLFVKQINELIDNRKSEILKWFKYFENSQINDLNQIETIIEIKKNIIKKNFNESIFYQIHGLYNKLIELSSNKDEGSDFSIYVKKLQEFLEDYDIIKIKENKEDKKVDEYLNNNYNFGFE